MSAFELERVAIRRLLMEARETLVQEQQLTAEKAKDYLYELAQARKLFLADAAAQVVAAEMAASASQSSSPGSTNSWETHGGQQLPGDADGIG
jgi:hypothetical protein